MTLQVCHNSWMNINYKENGERKAFLVNPKHLYHVCQYREYDCCATTRKSGDYYKYPGLYHDTNIH